MLECEWQIREREQKETKAFSEGFLFVDDGLTTGGEARHASQSTHLREALARTNVTSRVGKFNVGARVKPAASDASGMDWEVCVIGFCD